MLRRLAAAAVAASLCGSLLLAAPAAASALAGAIQMGMGALTSSLPGMFADGTPAPMCAAIAGCALVAFAINRWGTPK